MSSRLCMNYFSVTILLMEFITSILSHQSLAYLNVSDYNVILIDWREAAKQSYLKSVKSVPFVSQRVAHLIDFLENNVNL